ncbi:MAG: SIS domain-containing protein [Deltaproteobacteria bacterium]|nr:SIS domain-containing protein [Deltaproteobacteria bacterium]
MSFTTYLRELDRLLSRALVTDHQSSPMGLNQGANRAVDMILDTARREAKVMIMGNGGSAAIASHFHNDLSKSVGVRSLVFDHTPLLTALANDHGYACVFERPLAMWAEEGDLAMIISSSGGSENVLRAADCASRLGCRLITLSGFKPDNPLRHQGDLNFYIASESYGLVETGHSVITHFLTDKAMARIMDLKKAQKEKKGNR